jgi:hypothetical protein
VQQGTEYGSSNHLPAHESHEPISTRTEPRQREPERHAPLPTKPRLSSETREKKKRVLVIIGLVINQLVASLSRPRGRENTRSTS